MNRRDELFVASRPTNHDVIGASRVASQWHTYNRINDVFVGRNWNSWC